MQSVQAESASQVKARLVVRETESKAVKNQKVHCHRN